MPALALVLGLGVGAAFVVRQLRSKNPLMDVRLFRTPAVAVGLVVLLLGGAAAGGVSYLFAQFLQLVAGLSALHAGFWLVPDSLGMIVSSLLAPVIARRFRPAYVITGGLVVSLLGFVVLAHIPATGGLPVALTGIVIVFFGHRADLGARH
nr:hypothetical protein [Fodinicola feengrottensis]